MENTNQNSQQISNLISEKKSEIESSLKTLKANEFAFIKAFTNPPNGIKLSFKLSSYAFKEYFEGYRNGTVTWEDPKSSKYNWKSGFHPLGNLAFVKFMDKILEDAQKGELKMEIEKIKSLLDEKDLKPENIKNISTAASSLCLIIRNVIAINDQGLKLKTS